MTLLVSETTGALSPEFVRALRALAATARAPTTQDSTRYGVSRGSPHLFDSHHSAAISHAIVSSDATTLLLAAAALSFKLSIGLVG